MSVSLDLVGLVLQPEIASPKQEGLCSEQMQSDFADLLIKTTAQSLQGDESDVPLVTLEKFVSKELNLKNPITETQDSEDTSNKIVVLGSVPLRGSAISSTLNKEFKQDEVSQSIVEEAFEEVEYSEENVLNKNVAYRDKEKGVSLEITQPTKSTKQSKAREQTISQQTPNTLKEDDGEVDSIQLGAHDSQSQEIKSTRVIFENSDLEKSKTDHLESHQLPAAKILNISLKSKQASPEKVTQSVLDRLSPDSVESVSSDIKAKIRIELKEEREGKSHYHPLMTRLFTNEDVLPVQQKNINENKLIQETLPSLNEHSFDTQTNALEVVGMTDRVQRPIEIQVSTFQEDSDEGVPEVQSQGYSEKTKNLDLGKGNSYEIKEPYELKKFTTRETQESTVTEPKTHSLSKSNSNERSIEFTTLKDDFFHKSQGVLNKDESPVITRGLEESTPKVSEFLVPGSSAKSAPSIQGVHTLERQLKDGGLQIKSTGEYPARQLMGELRTTLQTGKDRMHIRFDPPELGKFSVKLDFTSEGNVRAVIVVDKPETYDYLIKNPDGLRQALESSGLKSDMQFDLRDQGSSNLGKESLGSNQSGQSNQSNDRKPSSQERNLGGEELREVELLISDDQSGEISVLGHYDIRV